MQDMMMVQVTFIDVHSREHNVLRTGELVNTFRLDPLGLDVDAAENGLLDVLCQRGNGDFEVFQVNQAQIDEMVPVARRNGQWVVVR